jgi:hypothetical protein
MIPVVYTRGPDSVLRVLAFSTDGVVISDKRMVLNVNDYEASSFHTDFGDISICRLSRIFRLSLSSATSAYAARRDQLAPTECRNPGVRAGLTLGLGCG